VNGGLISIDDGNYRYKNVNTAYVNMIRTRLGLPSIDIEDNKCAPFWEEVEGLLKKHFNRIENQDGGTYRETFKSDLFWTYYAADRKNMADLGMEKLNELAHRFDAWLVYND
jgi:tRNA-dihydrouridine synthase